jgi:hypothetical protein
MVVAANGRATSDGETMIYDPQAERTAATQTLIAVAPNKMALGYEPSRVAENPLYANPPLAYIVMPLGEMLTRRFETDAHAVSYVVTGATRQPRINKRGLAEFRQEVRRT